VDSDRPTFRSDTRGRVHTGDLAGAIVRQHDSLRGSIRLVWYAMTTIVLAIVVLTYAVVVLWFG
jgi:hypothetical protein